MKLCSTVHFQNESLCTSFVRRCARRIDRPHRDPIDACGIIAAPIRVAGYQRQDGGAMTNTCRREATLLAVFLAQFEPVAEGQKPTLTRLTAREIDQWREDYAQALQWSAATSFSANDVVAIKEMRRRYGFTSAL